MAGKKFWEKLSPRAKQQLRVAVWVVIGIAVLALMLLLLRGAELLHDLFRAGLRDVYYN